MIKLTDDICLYGFENVEHIEGFFRTREKRNKRLKKYRIVYDILFQGTREELISQSNEWWENKVIKFNEDYLFPMDGDSKNDRGFCYECYCARAHEYNYPSAHYTASDSGESAILAEEKAGVISYNYYVMISKREKERKKN